MQRTNIGWVLNDDGSPGYSWNPIEGECPVGCPYCWARDMRKRFKRYSGDPKLKRNYLDGLRRLGEGDTVFVCSTIELFLPGKYMPSSPLTTSVLNATRELPKIRWLFLTKRPTEAAKSILGGKISSHSWVGVSRTGNDDWPLARILRASHHWSTQLFASFEPLLAPLPNEPFSGFHWLIIGSLNLNGRPVPPDKGGTRIEWVWPILERADKLGIPVFIKKELLRLYPELPKRREVPWTKN